MANKYRLILPLPARSLLEDHQSRIEQYLIKYSVIYPQREISLVVDTGSKMSRYIYKDGEKVPSRASNPRRHLYKGDVVLTTLDKFIYRYFGYGDTQKSFIYPLRINDDNNRTLICFDEAHSYDKISFTNFSKLVQALYEASRNIVLMTATLPDKYLKEFDYLQDNLIDYIDDSDNLKQLNDFQQQFLQQPYLNQKKLRYLSDIQYPPLSDDDEERKKEKRDKFLSSITDIIIDEWRSSKKNNRIITVVESVNDAVEIYKQLKEELNINGNERERFLFLYHGRISNTRHHKEDKNYREAIYQQIKDRNEDEKPYIIITTRAIEVGCDLNAQVLITQLCSPENLIQRAGRCNRKGNIADANIIVVGNNIPNFVNTLSESELKAYRETLQRLHRQNFDAKEIMKCVSDIPQIDDFRIVELFSQLHDYVYEGDLTFKPIHEKGLVITRSWIPSVTLVYDDGKHGEDVSSIPQITLPIDRLTIKKDKETGESKNQYSNIEVYERIYDKENTRWKLMPLRWGCAYKKNIIIKIDKVNDGADYYDDKPDNPYQYNPELGFVDLPGVFVKWKVKDFEQRLGYTDKDKTVAINYITPINNEIY